MKLGGRNFNCRDLELYRGQVIARGGLSSAQPSFDTSDRPRDRGRGGCFVLALCNKPSVARRSITIITLLLVLVSAYLVGDAPIPHLPTFQPSSLPAQELLQPSNPEPSPARPAMSWARRSDPYGGFRAEEPLGQPVVMQIWEQKDDERGDGEHRASFSVHCFRFPACLVCLVSRPARLSTVLLLSERRRRELVVTGIGRLSIGMC